jgi:hypothetical protein
MFRIIFGFILVLFFWSAVLGNLIEKKGNLAATLLISSMTLLIPGILLIYFGFKSRKKTQLDTQVRSVPNTLNVGRKVLDEIKRSSDDDQSPIESKTTESNYVANPLLSYIPPVVSKEQNESYYGLSCVGANQVQYNGSLRRVELNGCDMMDFVQGMPSAHLIILPQLGLIVAIKSPNDFRAFQFKSAMSKKDATHFFDSMLQQGKKINIIEKFGAFELVEENSKIKTA